MSVGQPRVKRKQRNLDRKRQSKSHEQQRSSLRRKDERADLQRIQDRDKIERSAKTGLIGVNVIKGDDRDQHQQAAERRER